jgi:hypothetical protein
MSWALIISSSETTDRTRRTLLIAEKLSNVETRPLHKLFPDSFLDITNNVTIFPCNNPSTHLHNSRLILTAFLCPVSIDDVSEETGKHINIAVIRRSSTSDAHIALLNVHLCKSTFRKVAVVTGSTNTYSTNARYNFVHAKRAQVNAYLPFHVSIHIYIHSLRFTFKRFV